MSSVTEDIKARLDIVSYISQYAPLKKQGRHYKACCPFHSEKTPSFVVNQDRQSWRCFGACAEGGDIFGFAMKQHGWTFSEALRELGQLAGVEVRKQSPLDKQRTERHDRLRSILQTAAESYHQKLIDVPTTAARQTWAYVRDKRGLDLQTVEQFGIGYAPDGWQTMLEELEAIGFNREDIIEAGLAIRNDNGRVYDRFRNRLMIPIKDERGRVIGFGARALNPDDIPKYLNSPQTDLFDKSKVLFGLDMARGSIQQTETAVIVEGYLDVIQAHQAGFTNVVAQMGTAMTEAQLKSIVPRYAKQVVLALDSDAAGQNATRRSLETARQTLEADYAGRLSVDIRVLQIPDAKDPDDLIREAPENWQKLVENAVPVADYVIESEVATLPPNPTIQQREAIARSVLPILIASENDLYRQDNVQRLARKLRIGEQDLLRWASEQKAKQQQTQRQANARTQRPRQQPPTAPSSQMQPPEPPPLDYDALAAPPPDVHDVHYEDGERYYDYAVEYDDSPPEAKPEPAAPPKAEPAFTPDFNGGLSRDYSSETADLERYCLYLLLTQPDGIYQVNRALREMAANNAGLHAGPLCDLCVEDFTHYEHRILFEVFNEGLAQHELDVQDYMQTQLDPALQTSLAGILSKEAEAVHRRLQQRHTADFATLWRTYERRTQPSINQTGELIEKVLRLRLHRLRQQTDELSFALMDTNLTNNSDDPDNTVLLQISSQLILTKQARQLLDIELSQKRNQFT